MQAVTNYQIRAARELLGLSQMDLAAATKICVRTIGLIEAGRGNPKLSSMTAILSFFEGCGVTFVDTPGVVGRPVGALRELAESRMFGASDREVRA